MSIHLPCERLLPGSANVDCMGLSAREEVALASRTPPAPALQAVVCGIAAETGNVTVEVQSSTSLLRGLWRVSAGVSCV